MWILTGSKTEERPGNDECTRDRPGRGGGKELTCANTILDSLGK